MKVISVINYKGGVGKTTLTANIAAELARCGKRVLLLDADAQCSLTFSFLSPQEWKENLGGDKRLGSDKTIKHWFDGISSEGEIPVPGLEELIVPKLRVHDYVRDKGGSIDLIPSHLGLINVDVDLAYMLSGAPELSRVNRRFVKVHGELRKALAKISGNPGYDVALIDCPPNFNIVTKNAIVASDGILIPAKPDYLSTLGISYLVFNHGELVKKFNECASSEEDAIHPKIMGVVFTMVQINRGHPINAQQPYMEKETIPASIFPTYVRENKTIFADAPETRVPAILHEYSQQTHSNIVLEMEALTKNFWREVRKLP